MIAAPEEQRDDSSIMDTLWQSKRPPAQYYIARNVRWSDIRRSVIAKTTAWPGNVGSRTFVDRSRGLLRYPLLIGS